MSETAWVVAGAIFLMGLDVAALIHRRGTVGAKVIWGHALAYGVGAGLVAAWMVQRAVDGVVAPLLVGLAAGAISCLGSVYQLKRARALRERLGP